MPGSIVAPLTRLLAEKADMRDSAIACCALERRINMLEQCDMLAGLIMNRVVDGITAILLLTILESWLAIGH